MLTDDNERLMKETFLTTIYTADGKLHICRIVRSDAKISLSYQ